MQPYSYNRQEKESPIYLYPRRTPASNIQPDCQQNNPVKRKRRVPKQSLKQNRRKTEECTAQENGQFIVCKAACQQSAAQSLQSHIKKTNQTTKLKRLRKDWAQQFKKDFCKRDAVCQTRISAEWKRNKGRPCQGEKTLGIPVRNPAGIALRDIRCV